MTPTITFRRYLWLIDLLYTRGALTKETIDRYWATSHLNEDQEDRIPRRTFYRMLEAILEIFGIEISCNRSEGNKYFIDGLDDLKQGSARRYILQLFAVSNLLHDSADIQSRILLEDTPAASNQCLPDIVEALKENLVLQVKYQSFTMQQAYTFEVEPYCLRNYKQRWYMLVRRIDNGNMRLLALDRMQALQKTNKHFRLPKDFDAKSYFSQVYGITVTKDKPEQVIISVGKEHVPYLRSLPLHSSQEEIETHDSYSLFSFYLIVNEEFCRELRACGRDILVLAPEWLRQEFQSDAKLLTQRYNEDYRVRQMGGLSLGCYPAI